MTVEFSTWFAKIPELKLEKDGLLGAKSKHRMSQHRAFPFFGSSRSLITIQ